MKKRVYAKLGYSAIETLTLTNTLNKLLASMSVHCQKLRNYHWNVKGADFFEVHEKFDKQYNWTQVAADDIAERVRVFGQTPLSTLKEYLDISVVKETTADLTSKEMIGEILKDFRILLEQMFDVIDEAIESGDSGTEEMMKGMVKKIEKDHWMLTAFSQ